MSIFFFSFKFLLSYEIWIVFSILFQGRRKYGIVGSNSLDLSFEEGEVTKQTRLYYAHTESSRWKKRALENVYDLFSDLESDEEGT